MFKVKILNFEKELAYFEKKTIRLHYENWSIQWSKQLEFMNDVEES